MTTQNLTLYPGLTIVASKLYAFAANGLERAFWVAIVFIGAIIALNLVSTLIKDWQDNPTGKQNEIGYFTYLLINFVKCFPQ